jgi:cobalamin biosynthesis Mg chelatase CobN
MPLAPSDNAKAPQQFDFSELELLRLICTQIQQDQVTSLKYFQSGVGFMHVRGEEKEGDISVSSSATCVLSLVATGEWKAKKAETTSLAKKLLEKEKSAGLDPDNPFTTAWILDAVTALESVPEPFAADDHDKQRIEHKEKKLQAEIENSEDGSVSIASYPGSAYLRNSLSEFCAAAISFCRDSKQK